MDDSLKEQLEKINKMVDKSLGDDPSFNLSPTDDIPLPTAVQPVKSVYQTEKDKILSQATSILKEYGGLENNIPINHIYWDLMNQFRSKKY